MKKIFAQLFLTFLTGKKAYMPKLFIGEGVDGSGPKGRGFESRHFDH